MSGTEPDLTRIFASLDEGVWQRDLIGGQAWYSPRFKQLLGFADDELPNEVAAFAERFHPEDQALVEQLQRSAIETLRPTRGDVRMRMRDGEWHWFRASMLVWPDADGRPALLVGSVADVHAEKRAVYEGKALAERFDRAMAASSEAHFESTVGLDDFFMSARIATLLGHPPGTSGPSSETYLSWVHPDDRPGLLDVVRNAARNEGPWVFDYRLRHVDGNYRWFGGRGRSERDEQGRLRMSGMVGDIQAQKLAQQAIVDHREQLQQLVDERTASLTAALALAESQRSAAERANLAKASFLGHMSHELRTPLNGVMGLNQLALRIASSDTQRRYLELAEQSSVTLLRILNDVLDFAKAEAGKLQLLREPFDLPRVVVETVRSLIPQVGKRPLHVLFDDRGDVDRVLGDAGRVRQIVSNVVGNALKFTERGCISVRVEAVRTASDLCDVRIVVADSGPGMAAELLPRVFEAFEQGDSSITRRHGGTGLGLPIVRLLAQMMSGRVEVESQPGIGSTFTVHLRLGLDGSAAPRRRTSANPGYAWLVYRSEVPGRWVQQRLRACGWSADIVAGIPAALERLRGGRDERPPDSVIVADEALTDAALLAPLRRALPASVPIALLFRPDFQLPVMHEAAAAARVELAIAPLTTAELLCTLRPDAPPAAAAPEATSSRSTAPPLVLVVEDIELNQLVVGEMIRLLGLRAGIASSGEEALQQCSDTAPDLVLMDIQMPGMDGLETSRRLRRMQAEDRLPRFPIVALTANAMEADRRASLEAGIDDHLTKPIDLEALRGVLARWLPVTDLTA